MTVLAEIRLPGLDQREQPILLVHDGGHISHKCLEPVCRAMGTAGRTNSSPILEEPELELQQSDLSTQLDASMPVVEWSRDRVESSSKAAAGSYATAVVARDRLGAVSASYAPGPLIEDPPGRARRDSTRCNATACCHFGLVSFV